MLTGGDALMYGGNNGEDAILKKVDVIRERTGVSYRQAKEALEKNQGDLLQTLIDLEDHSRTEKTSKTNWTENWTEEFSIRSNEVIEKVKDLVRQGNVTKIRIKHEGRVLADIPVSLGAIGAVVLPQLAALGVLVAVFKQCTIEVVRTGDPNSKNDAGDEDNPKNYPF